MASISLHLRSVETAYQQCTNYLDNGRAKDQKKIGANTTLRREDGKFVIHYHNTDIIFIHQDRITVSVGSWQTITTKQQLNEILSFARFWSQKGLWHVCMNVYAQSVDEAHHNKVHLFANGITFWKGGRVTNAAKPSAEDKSKKLRKQITTYANEYAEALIAGKIAAPNGGDCWFCSMKSNDGRTLGEMGDDKDHLLSHIKENYFVPSIIANLAIAQRGYLKNIGLPTLWDANIHEDMRAVYLAREANWIKRDAKNLIRRSFIRKLGLAAG